MWLSEELWINSEDPTAHDQDLSNVMQGYINNS